MAEALPSFRPKLKGSNQELELLASFGQSGKRVGEFWSPKGVGISSKREIILADTNNNRLQIFDFLGNVKRVIKPAIPAQGLLNNPLKVAFYPKNGFIFVAQRTLNDGVKVFNSMYHFHESLRDGRPHRPTKAIAVDNMGRVLVLEHDQSGSALTTFTAGETSRRRDLSKTLMSPSGLAAWDEKAYISDYKSEFIQVFNYSGENVGKIGGEQVTANAIGICMSNNGNIFVGTVSYLGFKLVKMETDGTPLSFFDDPNFRTIRISDMAVRGEYVVIVYHHNVRVYKCPKGQSNLDGSDSTKSGEIERRTIAWRCGFSLEDNMSRKNIHPVCVTVDACDNIYVGDLKHLRIQVFDSAGRRQGEFGNPDVQTGFRIMDPWRMAVDKRTNNILLLERSPTAQIVVFDKAGRYVTTKGRGILHTPRAFAIDKYGQIFVVEKRSICIKIFDVHGIFLRSVPITGVFSPADIAVSEDEEIFIADNSIHCIHVFAYSGVFKRRFGNYSLTKFPTSVKIVRRGLVAVADNKEFFNMTFFTEEGKLVSAYESVSGHLSCNDMAVLSNGSIVLASDGTYRQIFLYWEN